jgi:precorrin-6A/cobalt-precorrin-6A reductase
MVERHRPGAHQRLWLIAGTGEGPPLAAALLARGWQVRVSVVGAPATRAYGQHPQLHCQVGALGEGAALGEALGQWPCRWVVDATHPFAQKISGALASSCGALGQPLLRLSRASLPLGRALLLPRLDALADQPLEGQQLLIALGARQLGEALAHSRASGHGVRLLPSAAALGQALALGIPAERLACLRPGGSGAVEAALCRRWGISAVLSRQSGGITEQLWQRICNEANLQLLLIARPDPAPSRGLELEALLNQLGWPSLP